MATDPRRRGYYRSQRDEARRQREIANAMRDRRMREASGDNLTEEEEAEYREFIESREFGTYQVVPLANKKENYGKGPTKSTRVGAHKFVPSSRSDSLFGPALAPNSGTVYVRFNRPSRSQIEAGHDVVIYRYKNVPVAVYESFRNNFSKGAFINNPLNSYKDGIVSTGDVDWAYCADM